MSSKKRKSDILKGFNVSVAKKSRSSEELASSSSFSQSFCTELEVSDNKTFSASDFDSSAMGSINQSHDEVFESSSKMGDFPDSISLMQFAECRASEIAHMMEQVKGKKRKQSIQQLPHHMRRRAASHNAKRVPRRLREKSQKEISKAKVSKRPSRKHRRRPSNLLAEYTRRQREFVWLETHIWFAKRFKVQNLWGYKIPIQPNDKSVRASYRALSQYAILQDLSYYCCIELEGPQNVLLRSLSILSSSLSGPTFASRMYLGGLREGQTILYHPHSYPYRCIGPVSFLWRPVSCRPILDSSMLEEAQKFECSIIRQLWIWCHPMCHEELVGALTDLFSLKSSSDLGYELSDVQNSVPLKSVKEDTCWQCPNKNETYNLNKVIKTEKLSMTNEKDIADKPILQTTCKDAKLEHRLKRSVSSSSPLITMNVLKDTLVRHRLIGPLSHAIVVDSLKPSEVSLGEGKSLTVTDFKWWENYYQNHEMMSLHIQQKDTWKNMQEIESQMLLPPGVVIGITVKDPRLDLPKVKTNASSKPGRIWKNASSAFSQSSLHSLAHSPLWEKNVRDEATATKVPESEINKLRSQFVVPGTRLDIGRDESRVPVIAIHQPGHNGLACGWDIIAPLGWSMPFWIAFVYRGARAFGLREFQNTALESSIPLFPCNFPDTSSGMESSESSRLQMMEKHYRYPPDKRPSFEKLGIQMPYFMPWETLTAEWVQVLVANEKSQSSVNESTVKSDNLSESKKYTFPSYICDLKTFFVLREKTKINLLRNACDVLIELSRKKIPQKTPKFFATWSAVEEFASLVRDFDTVFRRALICVKLKCINRGKPSKYSGIYLLDQVDLGLLKNSTKYSGPTESVHLTNKCASHRKATDLDSLGSKCKDSFEPSDMDHENIKNRLARPEVDCLILHCSRKLIGFVEVGDFSFTNACGSGLGHCSLIGFLEILRMCSETKISPTVLIRAQDSFQYRAASIEVIDKIF